MTDEAVRALARWERWVTELEDHPLDRDVYEALLAQRDRLAERLEVAGDEQLWARADELDARFGDVTIEVAASWYPRTAGAGSWWRRVPASDEAQRYLGGEPTNTEPTRGSDR